MTRRLLVLGSDDGTGAPIEAALAALAELGPVERFTPVRRMRDDGGSGRWYMNLLACVDSPLGREPLRERLRGIERRLGRSRRDDGVAIDIDLLATASGDGWRVDAHAAGKGEHRKVHVRMLLDEADIEIRD